MQIPLSNLPWTVHSPSLLELVRPDGSILIGFDGVSWLIGINGIYGTREFKTRDEAAALVAHAINTAYRENLG